MLLNPQPVTIEPTAWSPVLVMSVLSAFFTLIAYISMNTGIRHIGASLTALLSATAPALTMLLAWWLMQEALQIQQVIGIGLVTIGVGALSLKSSHADDAASWS